MLIAGVNAHCYRVLPYTGSVAYLIIWDGKRMLILINAGGNGPPGCTFYLFQNGLLLLNKVCCTKAKPLYFNLSTIDELVWLVFEMPVVGREKKGDCCSVLELGGQ